MDLTDGVHNTDSGYSNDHKTTARKEHTVQLQNGNIIERGSTVPRTYPSHPTVLCVLCNDNKFDEQSISTCTATSNA